jgi:hypothetical protein
MKWMRMVALMLVAVATTIGVTGCEPKNGKGPAERAGEAIDDTIDKVDDKLKDAAEDAKDAVKDAAEDAKEAVKGAADDAKKAVED